MADAPGGDPSRQVSKAPRGPLKAWQKNLIWVAVATTTGLGGYAFGRIQAAAYIDAAKAETKAFEQKATESKNDASRLAQKVQRLEARRQLHLMLQALEDRNFGIAKAHQTKAARLVKDNSSDPELDKLATDMDSMTLVATEDLGVQRRRVLDWAKRFDRSEPPP